MKDENEELTAMIDRLIALCGEKARGDILSHNEIATILGVRPYETFWTQAVQKFKRRFEAERGITLWKIVGVGYKLSTLEEQFSDVPKKRIKFGMRQVVRGIKSVEAPVAEKIPQHLQAQRAFMRDALRQKKSSLHGELIRQGIFSKKQEPPPRVPFK